MENLTPITRKETFLAKAAGQDVETPTPVTREEVFLDAIAKGGGGGGGGLPAVTSADNGKVLAVKDGAWAAGVQEYWIPLEYSEGALRIPEGKDAEIANALSKPDIYWVRGVKLGLEFYAGYVENDFGFIVPLEKSFMEERGYNCAGRIRLINDAGIYKVSVEPEKYIVTLTPTSLDYSGTMDKTVAEINAAYEAGQQIVFRVYSAAGTYNEADCTIRYKDENYTYPSFNAYIVNNTNNVLMFAYTGAVDDGTRQTYATTIYSLTPAS